MINRDRLTEHVNLSTLKIELRRALGPLVMLLIGFAATAGAGYYILQNINGGVGTTHEIKFEVADATGVVPGRAEVRFYGIEAGLVDNVQLIGGHAVLTASVANKFGPVYKDALAQVRPNTALQDMYLDIVSRGTKSAGVAGSNYTVPVTQTTSPTNLADVLNTFQPDVRTQLYNLIDQFGNGLADRGADLRQAFVELAPFLQIAGNVTKQLAVRATLTKALVHNASVLSSTLASRSVQLHQLVSAGTQSLNALSTQGGQPLRATISLLPQFTATAHAILVAITQLNPVLNTALHRLYPVADELPSGLRDIRALARSADPAVRKLEAPVVKLVPLADQLQPFSSYLASSLTDISPQVQDVNTVATDAANCVPWMDEFFNWDASMSKWHDDLGEMVRGNLHFGFYSTFLFKPSNFTYGYQCAGGAPLGDQPIPKYNGPPPAP